MRNNVEDWVNKWAIADNDDIYRNIIAQVNFYAKELFHDYQPTQHQNNNFLVRLENWLLNVADESDKKTLFKLLPHLFYIGSKEFTALYRVAYNEIIASWLIDTDRINFNDFNLANMTLNKAIRECWICPITDSFNVNLFFHINNIPNNGWNEWRPQWYTIARSADGGLLWHSYYNYIFQRNIKKIVLLEDFVGSGSQIGSAIEFVMEKKLDIDVLLISLVNCPKGVERFNTLASKYDRLVYKAVIELSDNSFVKDTPHVNENPFFNEVRELIKRVYLDTSGGIPIGNSKPYSPFGYKNTGGLVVMNSNTPDNSLPSIHYTSDTWKPIFPRHSRN